MHWSIIISFILYRIFSFANSEVTFQYDPASEFGPQHWGTIDIPGHVNQCNGSSQSGINIPTSPCDELNADYIFHVCVIFTSCSNVLHRFVFTDLLFLTMEGGNMYCQ